MPGFYETIIRGKAKGQLLAAWIIDGEGAGTKALFDQQEQVFRDEGFPAELAEGIRTMDCPQAGLLEQNGSQVFLERISDGKRLVICGAGHVALCVIRIGVMLGYEITVIEDRREFAEKAGEAGAHRVICKPFGEALEIGRAHV